MDAERARAFLLSQPHATETLQWGENLVFWVGDKAVGGKMFALMNLDGRGGPVMSFAAGLEHAAELREREGLIPAPYFARIGWIAAEHWDALGPREWHEELAAAHALVLAKLPARTRAALTLRGEAKAVSMGNGRLSLTTKPSTRSVRKRGSSD